MHAKQEKGDNEFARPRPLREVKQSERSREGEKMVSGVVAEGSAKQRRGKEWMHCSTTLRVLLGMIASRNYSLLIDIDSGRNTVLIAVTCTTALSLLYAVTNIWFPFLMKLHHCCAKMVISNQVPWQM